MFFLRCCLDVAELMEVHRPCLGDPVGVLDIEIRLFFLEGYLVFMNVKLQFLLVVKDCGDFGVGAESECCKESYAQDSPYDKRKQLYHLVCF